MPASAQTETLVSLAAIARQAGQYGDAAALLLSAVQRAIDEEPDLVLDLLQAVCDMWRNMQFR